MHLLRYDLPSMIWLLCYNKDIQTSRTGAGTCSPEFGVINEMPTGYASSGHFYFCERTFVAEMGVEPMSA